MLRPCWYLLNAASLDTKLKQADTHIMEPGDVVDGRVGVHGAEEGDPVALLQLPPPSSGGASPLRDDPGVRDICGPGTRHH